MTRQSTEISISKTGLKAINESKVRYYVEQIERSWQRALESIVNSPLF